MDKLSDPFAPLTESEIACARQQAESIDSKPSMKLVCPPAGAEDGEAAAARLFRRKPDAAWRYYTAEGTLAFLMLRWNEGEDKKTIRPLSWVDGEGWRAAAWPAKRPLYNLPAIIEAPEASVIVCEGEKSADAAAAIFPESTITTSCGGSGAAAKSDWSPLAGRLVLIWPDNDAPGRSFAKDVVAILVALGAKVSAIDAQALATIGPAGGAREPPKKGWDAADAAYEWGDFAALCEAISGLCTDITAKPIYGFAAKPERIGLDLDMPRDALLPDAPSVVAELKPNEPLAECNVVGLGSRITAPKPRKRSVPQGDQLLTEDAAAIEFARRYGGRLRFDHDAGVWREWTGAVWRENKTGLAFHRARELARELTENVPGKVKLMANKTSFTSGVERYARADPTFATTTEY